MNPRGSGALASFAVPPDEEPTLVRSRGTEAVAYRAVFPDGGWIRFVVPPGGSFEIRAAAPVNVHVDELLPGGIRGGVETKGRRR